jgi:hypothetical protein
MLKETRWLYLKCCAGEPEPSTMSEGQTVYELRTHTHESRVVDEVTGRDRIVRRSLKAPSIKELKEAAADPDNPGTSSFFPFSAGVPFLPSFCWLRIKCNLSLPIQSFGYADRGVDQKGLVRTRNQSLAVTPLIHLPHYPRLERLSGSLRPASLSLRKIIAGMCPCGESSTMFGQYTGCFRIHFKMQLNRLFVASWDA